MARSRRSSQWQEANVHHTQRRAAMDMIIRRGHSLVISAHALAEIGGVVARVPSRQLATGAVRQVLRLPGPDVVPMSAALGRAGAETAIRLRLKGADATYVAVAAAPADVLVTWDREVPERASASIAMRTLGGRAA